MSNKKIEQMKGKRMDLEKALDRLGSKMHEFERTHFYDKMERKEMESLTQQIERLKSKLEHWIKMPSPKNDKWFCIRCANRYKGDKICPKCGADESTFEGND